MIRRISFAITTLVFAATTALSAQMSSQLGLTFGGTGIDNSSVVTNDSSSIHVLLGLTATPRCYNAPPETCGPAVTNDGVNTFFAQPGDGELYTGSEYDALWNFDFAAVGPDFDSYQYALLYDENPAIGNGTTGSFSVPDIYCIVYPVCYEFIQAQDSENLTFFNSAFDPTANGQYEFDLVACDPAAPTCDKSDALSSAQMFVDVGDLSAITPEPATMSLLALGLVGLAGVKRRKRNR